MILIIYSDIQFHPWTEFSTILSTGLNSRFQDQLNVQGEIFDYARSFKNQGKDVILIHCGDLFESLSEKIDKITFLTVYEKFVEFSKEGIVTVLLVGNHDLINRSETGHILEPFKEIENVLVIDEPKTEIIDRVGLSFLPYTKIDLKSKVDCLADAAQNGINYLFIHQGISGALTGPRDFALKDEFNPKDFRPDVFQIFGGHYHKSQDFLNGRLRIVGSPLQKDFGERNDKKGFWVLDTGEEPRNPIFIETHGPKFYKIEIKKDVEFGLPKNFTNQDFLWVVAEDNSIYASPLFEKIKDRVRVDVRGDAVVKPRTNIGLNLSVSEQLKKYVDYVRSDLDKEKLLEMGLDKFRKAIL